MEATGDPEVIALRWFGTRHELRAAHGRPFSEHELRLARSIGQVLEARYSAIFDPRLMVEHAELFQGTIDDHYVGAFLDGGTYQVSSAQPRADQVAAAIEVLRVAALSSYENRAISSGVLLLEGEEDPCASRRASASPLTYTQALTGVKSFYRMCDGLNTVVLANRAGHLVDIVDIARWSTQNSGAAELEAPCPSAFRAHALATRGGGHVCVVLSPQHEIKVFAEGAQVFSFHGAAWHLLDVQAKYAAWARAVANPEVARRLFQVALDLSESRVGALFVVLRNPMNALSELVMPSDLIMDNPPKGTGSALSRRDFTYLLSSRNVVSMDQRVLEGLASIDGATVCDRDGRLIAVGAILRHPAVVQTMGTAPTEGARSTAALAASRFGPVL